MKIFNKGDDWDTKVNFVDDNNVVLGYDLSQSCCENADWFIAEKPTYDIVDRKQTDDCDLPGWNFDPNFFEEYNNEDKFGAGGMVIFRITNGTEEKFIHIFNSQNGYYGHGFNFAKGNECIKEGHL